MITTVFFDYFNFILSDDLKNPFSFTCNNGTLSFLFNRFEHFSKICISVWWVKRYYFFLVSLFYINRIKQRTHFQFIFNLIDNHCHKFNKWKKIFTRNIRNLVKITWIIKYNCKIKTKCHMQGNFGWVQLLYKANMTTSESLGEERVYTGNFLS